jgi:hypothetical protein
MIGWETLFARIASQIDDLPIARGSASAATDLGWEIIGTTQQFNWTILQCSALQCSVVKLLYTSTKIG